VGAIGDEVIEVTDEDAIETTRQLRRNLGLLVGISSGANVWAARQTDPPHDGTCRNRPGGPCRTLLQHGVIAIARPVMSHAAV